MKNLDHYLPKAKYPTLSVAPNNLIPSCRDCNMDKRDSASCDSQNIPVHLYFDDIPNEPWLHVTVSKLERSIFMAKIAPKFMKKHVNSIIKHKVIYS